MEAITTLKWTSARQAPLSNLETHPFLLRFWSENRSHIQYGIYFWSPERNDFYDGSGDYLASDTYRYDWAVLPTFR